MGYQQIKRDFLRNRSNNTRNRNKNVCGLAVASALGVQNATRYLHTWGDLQRAIRTAWSFRSVKSVLRVTCGETDGAWLAVIFPCGPTSNDIHLPAG